MAEIPAFPHFINPDQYKTRHVPELESKRTLQPIVTGTSVLGIRYEGGVMLAADTLGSYGSLARFRSLERLRKVGKYTVVAGSGEYSDYQFIMEELQKLIDRDFCMDDGHELTPKEIHQYLVRVMYARRNRFDPLWNSIVVAGVRDGKSFLGLVDLVGTHFEDNTVATGYGAYLAQPLLRKEWDEKQGKLTKEDARRVLEASLKVLFYRDCRALNKIQIATIEESGVEISEPYSLDTEWSYKGF